MAMPVQVRQDEEGEARPARQEAYRPYPINFAVISSAAQMRITGGCGDSARISATKAAEAGTAKWVRTAAISAHSSTKTRRSGCSTSTWQRCPQTPRLAARPRAMFGAERDHALAMLGSQDDVAGDQDHWSTISIRYIEK
jgi:hypothetical protein